jgi:hypothetical protein
MSSRYPQMPLERATLLVIGQRLRVEYDAIQEPLPPRLAALLHHFEMRAKEGKPAQSASLKNARGSPYSRRVADEAA